MNFVEIMDKDKRKYFDIYKQLGENIRKYRKKRKLSQEELALKISTVRNYIGCIERAERFPSVAILFEISKALNISLEDLFKDVNG